LQAYKDLIESLPAPVKQDRKPTHAVRRFSQLGSAARRAAAAFSQLDQRERQWLSAVMRANGETVADVEEWLSQTRDCARRIDAAANRIAKEVRQNTTRVPSHFLMTLIPDLARAYSEIYAKRPSAAPMGVFYRAVDATLRHAGIQQPGGRIMKRLIETAAKE
jgi:hypothetical protein